MMGRIRVVAAAVVLGLATAAPVPASEGGSSSVAGYYLPFASAEVGREFFVSTGCVICHSINGVGGAIGPQLDAEPFQTQLNPFEFTARMWRGASAMIALQNLELGFQIALTGEELANIAVFLHDLEAQLTFSEDEITDDIRLLMRSEVLEGLDL
ncbi:MAG: c-type cytochrome [Alphaproteobacteria bacterium]